MESLAFVSRKGTVIGEFEKQARFSNGGVTDNKKLKQVIVFVAHDVFFSAFNSKTSSSLHGKQVIIFVAQIIFLVVLYHRKS